MIIIGQINQLAIDTIYESGIRLIEPETQETVFMQDTSKLPEDVEVGQEVQAFIFLNKEDELVATSKMPHALVGEYALMHVLEAQEFGAFFDWGIEKDLLVPGNQQPKKVKKGEWHIIRVCQEPDTQRIYGSAKLGKFVQEAKDELSQGQQVELNPVRETDLGYKVIINKRHMGLIYRNEIFKPIEIGHIEQGYIRKIRSDGQIDASLQLQGIDKLEQAKGDILMTLARHNGMLRLHDKSSPEEIKEHFIMSKKTFKSAIGMLMKEKKLLIHSDHIQLVRKLIRPSKD